MFVLSLKNGNDDPLGDSLEKSYMPLIEIKDVNALIDNKPFFDQPVKNKHKACEELVKNDDYLTGNLLDHLSH